MKPGLQRRRAALPPIATVLIVIAAVVATGIVAWLLYSTTARAARTPIVSVVSVPTLYANCSLYVTLKNDGTAPVTLTEAKIFVQDKNGNPVTFTYQSGPSPLDPGSSGSYVFNAGAGFSMDSIPDGALATLQTTDGYQLSFAVAKPG
uniref:DUF4352 domain-containing protein n=1 Tax=Thermofilum pendens TaxID=2269 RepID=A0A7J3X6E1_THEPE